MPGEDMAVISESGQASNQSHRVSALESQIWMETFSGTVVPNSFSTPRGSRTARER